MYIEQKKKKITIQFHSHIDHIKGLFRRILK